MKSKKNVLYSLIILLAAGTAFSAQAQQKNDALDSVKSNVVSLAQGPRGIVRTIKQDRKGNIWIASWEGMFKYDGRSFTNVSSNVSSARFFSVLEDSKGNFWFASIGSGVYYYDGRSFQNFTTKDGLASDRVTNIYEDKTGTIWFGTETGVSRYNPSASLRAGAKRFQNVNLNEVTPVTGSDAVYTGPGVHAANDSVYVGPARAKTGTDSVYVGPGSVHAANDSVRSSIYQQPLPKSHWMHNDVNAIIEDNKGKFWFGTRGYAVVYDGKTFTTITNGTGKPFQNVRSIIKDKKGNILLGGNDGLWRYDGKTFTNLSQNFVGYIYEDKKGNIWISSGKDSNPGWTLSRYDKNTLADKNPAVTTIAYKPMIFGILEDDKGNIWFGDFDGVHRYDGKTITDFNNAGGQQ